MAVAATGRAYIASSIYCFSWSLSRLMLYRHDTETRGSRMKQYLNWRSALLFLLLSLSLQSCLGSSDNGSSNFKSTDTGSGQIGVNQGNQVVFQGKIYFMINHHLWVLDGSRNLHQLTGG